MQPSYRQLSMFGQRLKGHKWFTLSIANVNLLTVRLGAPPMAEGSVNPTDEKKPHHLEIRGHVSLKDKEVCDYRLLPFEVPAGIRRIEVKYAFSEDEPGGLWREAGNIVDIGLFDARGSE